MGISSLATKYGFQSFPHYSSGRSGAKVNKIVIHHMAGTNYDIVPSIWQTREASAHYGIGKTEKFVPMWMKTIRHGTRVTGMPISRVLGLKTATPMAHHHGV